MKKAIMIIGSFMFGFITCALLSANKHDDSDTDDDVEYVPENDDWEWENGDWDDWDCCD